MLNLKYEVVLRILHLTLGLGNGGAEGALYRLIKFDKLNQHTVISIMGDGIYGQKLRDIGVKVYSFDVKQGCIPLSIPFKIFKKIRLIKPDAIQTWLYHMDILGGILGRIAGVKYVFWGIRHSNLSPELNSKYTLLMSNVSAFLSKFIPVRIISCSQRATDVHIEIGYDSNKFTTIPNGYDLKTLCFSLDKRFDYRKKLKLNGQFVFGMVGRWNSQKNHRNLISALSLCIKKFDNNVKLILVGPDIDATNSELMMLIENYNMTSYIQLLGPTNDIPGIMSAMDVLVLPSLGEAFPNVVAEAMACTTPVIATNVGDAAYIVGDTGWIVPSNDANALSDSMFASYLASKDKSNWEVRKNACSSRVVNNFSIERMIKNYNDVWKSEITL